MKRLFGLLVAVLGLIGMSTAVQAQDFAPQSMAKYFPGDVNFYAAMRVDEEYVATLDDVVARITEKLPAVLNVPQMKISDALAMGLPPGVTLEGIRAFLGDYVAVGVVGTPAMDDTEAAYVAIAITDKAVAIEFLQSQAPNLEGTEDGDWTIYSVPDESSKIAIGSDVILLTQNELPDTSAALSDNESFTSAFAKLPASSYNIVAYVETAFLYASSLRNAPPEVMETLAAQGLTEEMIRALPATVVGFTILNDNSFAMDVVTPTVPGITPQLTPVDTAFLSAVPADMSFVIQAANLGSLVDVAVQASAAAGEDFDREQANQTLQALLGVDFDGLLELLGGNAVLFADLDMRPIGEMVAAGEEPTALPIRFGVALEVVDAEKTAKVRDSIITLLRAQGANAQSEIKTEEATIGNASGIVIRGAPLNLGSDMNQTIDIAIMSDDRVFVVADYASAEAIFKGGSDLTKTNEYQAESANFLPDPVVVAYTDGTGIGDTVMLGGFLFMSFGANDTPDPAEIVDMLGFGYELFNSTSITVSLTPAGDAMSRFVLTLK